MPSDKQLRIAWMPQFAARTDGYGFVSGRMAKALHDSGAHIVSRHETYWHGRIIVGLPAAYMLGREERSDDLVLHTMFEATPLPSRWPPILNRFRLIWTPSAWCATLFREHGVTVPIVVSGYGVDADIYSPGHDQLSPGRPLRFGIWAHAWTDRKNAWGATEAYVRSGIQDAQLEIKITDSTDLKHVSVDGKRRSDIRVHRGAWSLERLAGWLRSIDVLVYCSGGEGFGLQPLEAMACGVTPMAMINTGMADYLTPENCIPVPSSGRALSRSFKTMYGDEPFELETPDWDAVVENYRMIAANRDSLRQVRARALQTAAFWNWSRAGAEAVKQLSQHLMP